MILSGRIQIPNSQSAIRHCCTAQEGPTEPVDEARLQADMSRAVGLCTVHCALSTSPHRTPVRAAVQREANKLVEEFMLLANMSVAALIAGRLSGARPAAPAPARPTSGSWTRSQTSPTAW